jgi:ComF family protein
VFRITVDALVSVALAPQCAACGRVLDTPSRGAVCTDCWSAIVSFLPPLCRRCGDPLPSWRTISVESETCARCRRVPSALSACRAIGPYEGSLRTILHALKYRGRRSLATPLGRLIKQHGERILENADVVVPVPLHWRRQWRRGFNQAEEMAAGLGLPVAHVLRRTRATASQADLPAARRHANVHGAFSLRRRVCVSGLRLVLVDDVCTTGATLEACARVLRNAGAADVGAVTAARVVSRPRE